jgi:hypothetical protein
MAGLFGRSSGGIDVMSGINGALAQNAAMPRPKKKFDWGEAVLSMFSDPQIIAARQRRKAAEAALAGSVQPGPDPVIPSDPPPLSQASAPGRFGGGRLDYMTGIQQALERNEALRRRRDFDWREALLGAFADPAIRARRW